MIPTNRLFQVEIKRKRLTLSTECENYQSKNLRASRRHCHQKGPRQECPREFARGALSEEFISAQHDYAKGDCDWRSVQQRAG